MNKINLRLRAMVKVLPFYLFTFLPLTAGAQTFTQRIQTPVKGQGTVTIHEDAAIDQLVNSMQLAPARTTTTPLATTNTSGKSGKSTSGTAGNNAEKSASTSSTPTHANVANNATGNSVESTEEPVVDTSKKVMKGGYKVNGYRVQAFAGGNSRKDRQKAEQVGNAIKAQFGSVPVYVHFYSPRWICRVGNYRTYEEAHQMLSSIRKMGYTQATIVKGKITIQD